MNLPSPFSLEDLVERLHKKPASARVWLSRQETRGELVRIRRNLYVAAERWETLDEPALFGLANLIQTPSCISFATALSYYGLTTQITTSVVESLNPVRTKTYEVRQVTFRYHFCRPPFYFGCQKERNFFIALPEKALLDTLYLVSLGRYAWDESALDLKKVDWEKLKKYSKPYPARFKEFLQTWRKQHERP